MSQPFEINRIFKASPLLIWNALTNSNEMKQWYFDIPDFTPLVGFKFTFIGGTEECNYTHLCTITEAVPLQTLAYTWRYEGYDGDSLVTWRLQPTGNGTVLQLCHSGLDTFPSTNSDFALNSFVDGWNHIINKSLPTYLGE